MSAFFRASFVLLSAAAVLCGTGCEPQRGGNQAPSALDTVLGRGKLVVGVKRDSPPFGFQDEQGHLWGFDADLAQAIADRLKVKLEMVPVTSATRMAKLQTGEVDALIASCTITRARDESVDFSIPYFADQQAFLVKAGSPIRGYLDLAGKEVGAVEGSTGIDNLRIVQPDAKPVPCKDYAEAFEALKAGKVAAITSDSIILLGLIRKDRDAYKIVDKVGYEPYGIALRENDSKWRDRINGVLMDLWDDGVLQRIYDTWFSEHGKFPAQVKFIMDTYPKGQGERKN